MNRREFLLGSAALLGSVATSNVARATELLFDRLAQDEAGQRWAEGYVFHDRNGSGKRDRGDRGVGGVCVSNGREVVQTNRDGFYRLPVHGDCVLFVIKPRGWQVPLSDKQVPQCYYVHQPAGSPPNLEYQGVSPTGELPKSIDFSLRPQKEEDRFRMVLFGDPQPRNQKEVDYIAHDVVEQVVRDAKASDAKFGLSLGDIMFDDLSLYDSLNGVVSTIGLPWYNALGNHDLNFDSPDDAGSTETWKRVYGPTTYAFDYGPVHFIVLDNVAWTGKGYHAELSEDALAFVAADLSLVPKKRLVVVAMHIPVMQVRNKDKLFSILQARPYCLSLSAHTHVQAHHFLTDKDGWKGVAPHHHLNHATVCGSWWQGAPDERGIPHATMSDGGPNGYSIVEFDRHRYKITFRAASRPETEQMSIWIPEEVPVAGLAEAELIVNVWAGSERSEVWMRLDQGEWQPMERFIGKDPYFLELKQAEAGPNPPAGLKLPGAADTGHLWRGKLPTSLSPGTHRVDLKTRDMFGQVYEDTRVVRVSI